MLTCAHVCWQVRESKATAPEDDARHRLPRYTYAVYTYLHEAQKMSVIIPTHSQSEDLHFSRTFETF